MNMDNKYNEIATGREDYSFHSEKETRVKCPSLWQREDLRGEQFLNTLDQIPHNCAPDREFRTALTDYLASDARGLITRSFYEGENITPWNWKTDRDPLYFKWEIVNKLGSLKNEWAMFELWRLQEIGYDEETCWRAIRALEEPGLPETAKRRLIPRLERVLAMPEDSGNPRLFEVKTKAALILRDWSYQPTNGMIEARKLAELADKANYYNPSYIERKAQEFYYSYFSRFESNWEPLIRLFVLRQLREFIHSPGVNNMTIEDAIPMISDAFTERIRRFKRQEREATTSVFRPSVGAEVQCVRYRGVTTAKRVKAAESPKYRTTVQNHSDYFRISGYAGFIQSHDPYYEYSLPPTLRMSGQSLVISELIKLGYLPEDMPEGTFQVHLNVDGLKCNRGYKREILMGAEFDLSREHMEPFIMEIMLLATGYCAYPDDLLLHESLRETCWVVPVLSRTRNLKRVIGSTFFREVSELRMFWLTTPTALRRVGEWAQNIGGLAIGYQNRKSAEFPVEQTRQMAEAWSELATEAGAIFNDYGINLLGTWDWETFQKLGKILAKELPILSGERKRKRHSDKFLSFRMRNLLNSYSRRFKEIESTIVDQ